MEEREKIARLQEMVDQSHGIVFFGGAGVSTESGIPDFRSTDGLYHQQYAYPPKLFLSHTFYERKSEVFPFYRDKLLRLDAQPNAAHKKLAELEQAGKLRAVITQNIDGLHQKAGSKRVYELHGSVLRNYCEACGKFYDAEYMLRSDGVPAAAAAAGSNRMWCSMKRDWTATRCPVLCGLLRKQICSLWAARRWWSILRRDSSNTIGGHRLVVINKTALSTAADLSFS